MPKLSILGMYSYDETVFDNLSIPVGMEKDWQIQRILIDCGELPLVYADAPMMKEVIGVWSSTLLPIWDRLYKTTLLEYNPIDNLNVTESAKEVHDGEKNVETDSTEDSSDDIKRTIVKEESTGNTRTNNLTDTEIKDQDINDESTTTEEHDGKKITDQIMEKDFAVNSFEGSTVPKNNETTNNDNTETTEADDKSVFDRTYNDDTTTTTTKKGTVTDAGTHEANNSDNTVKEGEKTRNEIVSETTDNVITKDITRKGKQGNTSYQSLIDKERETVKFDIYGYIARCFIDRFCIEIY